MKFSIITVTFNCVKTIERTILSVLNQNYSDYEYIIIDGVSTDGTLKVIEKYKEQISYFLSEPDHGIYDAMNKGVLAARGEYIYFLNGDDRLMEGALSNVARYMDYTNAEIIYGDVLVGKKGNYRRESMYPLECISWTMPIYHQSAFVKQQKRLFDTSYKIAADYKLLNELYCENYRFQYVPCVIACYEEGGESGDWHRTGLEIVDIACRSMIKYKKSSQLLSEMITDEFIDVINRNMFFEKHNQKQLTEFLGSHIENKNSVIIWGMGKIANSLWDLLVEAGLHIDKVVDSASKKGENVFFHGVSVVPPQILETEKNCAVLILTEKYCAEILGKIKEMHLDGTVKIYDFVTCNNEYLRLHRQELIQIGKEMNDAYRTMLEGQ